MDALHAALLVSRAFESLGIPYLIGGSLASGVHGEPRSTNDVDFAALLRTEQVDALVGALAGDGFAIDAQWVREAVVQKDSFQMIHLPTVTKIDVYVRDADGFHGSELRRAQRTVLRASPRAEAFVATAEDMVVQKLVWFRAGGGMSDRQWRDVKGIFKARGKDLDFAYLHTWCGRLGVQDLLARALTESGLGTRSDPDR